MRADRAGRRRALPGGRQGRRRWKTRGSSDGSRASAAIVASVGQPGRKSAAAMLADDPTRDEPSREVLESGKATTKCEFPENLRAPSGEPWG
jgi:hypothetical protein